jgi:putative tricarboxylic transport membrane protein
MINRVRFAVIFSLLASLVLAACGGPDGTDTAASPPAAGGTEASPAAGGTEASPAADGAEASPAADGAEASPESAGGGEFEYPTENVSLMAPAAPGGGWDQTARALAPAISSVSDQNVQVFNVPGAAGTVGLAQFVNNNAGDPHTLMVMGLVMVGGIQTNNAPVDLTEVTPIASLATEWEAIVVPANSQYENLQQLMDDFQADPASISWGGGSAGSTDHILVGLLAQEAGVDPSQINYIAHSGGGEALGAILSGAVTAGVSGLAEVRDQVEAGSLRLLAVSSDEPVEGLDAPTIQEAGFDVVLPNWRGVVAPPGISDEQRAAITALIEQAHETQEWQQALEKNGWDDFFMTGDEFASFLTEETERVEGVLRDIGLIE